VNSSAPATTARIRPSEKPTPASKRVGPKPNSDPVPIVIAKTPPSAMKAPATTPSTKVVTTGAVALATPRVYTRKATSAGDWASWPVIG
jgi:hypothetical protein